MVLFASSDARLQSSTRALCTQRAERTEHARDGSAGGRPLVHAGSIRAEQICPGSRAVVLANQLCQPLGDEERRSRSTSAA